jgi:hypothetical protein
VLVHRQRFQRFAIERVDHRIAPDDFAVGGTDELAFEDHRYEMPLNHIRASAPGEQFLYRFFESHGNARGATRGGARYDHTLHDRFGHTGADEEG